MYSEKVMDHFMNPRNVGEIENADGIGEVGNMKCGDIMRIYLKVSDQEVIEDIKFRTFGCGAAIATSSAGSVKGRRRFRPELSQRAFPSCRRKEWVECGW